MAASAVPSFLSLKTKKKMTNLLRLRSPEIKQISRQSRGRKSERRVEITRGADDELESRDNNRDGIPSSETFCVARRNEHLITRAVNVKYTKLMPDDDVFSHGDIIGTTYCEISNIRTGNAVIA